MTTANQTIATSNILVVEDERIVANDIKSSLQSLGYNVPALAASAKEAVSKVAEFHPDLVLMDINLKGDTDGVEAAAQIYQGWHTPVVYLTAHSDQRTLKRATAVGAFGYILKPFVDADLLTTIETALSRYKLEKKLRESERWWATTLKCVGDAVIATDAKGRIKFLNPVAEALTGWSQDEACGREVTEVFSIIQAHNRNAIKNPVLEVLQAGTVVYLEDDAVLVSKHSIEVPIDDSAAPITDDQGKAIGAVVVFRDITERQQALASRQALERAQQLELQMAELQRLNQLKDNFLSTVSHELRTPMANIKVGINMLKLTLAQNATRRGISANLELEDGTAKRYLQILHDECEREISLINDLLDLQRLESGVQPLHLETIDLSTWLPQILQPFQVRSQNRQQFLHSDLPSNLPPLVADAASLERVCAELLHNACKYTPPGGEIAIAIRPTTTALQLLVSNSGVEIPESELSRIFDKFYRIPRSDPWKQGGTGLGLALVQKLVEHMEGSIQVKSGSGQTCFMVELPLHGLAG